MTIEKISIIDRHSKLIFRYGPLFFSVGVGVLALLFVYFGPNDCNLNTVKFDGAKSFSDVLLPAFVTAIFIERAVDVFVSTWRKLGRETKEAQLTKLKTDQSNDAQVKTLEQEISEYRQHTHLYAFVVNIAFAFIVAIAGIRVLAPFVDANTVPNKMIFQFADVLITTAALGGGAAFFHSFINTVTSFMEATTRKTRSDK